MKFIAGLVLMLVGPLALAAGPFVVSDPVSNVVTKCGVYIDASPKATVPVTATATGQVCQIDVGSLAPGTHSIKVTAISVDLAWGERESPQSLPLALVPPSPPSAPAGLRLVPSSVGL